MKKGTGSNRTAREPRFSFRDACAVLSLASPAKSDGELAQAAAAFMMDRTGLESVEILLAKPGETAAVTDPSSPGGSAPEAGGGRKPGLRYGTDQAIPICTGSETVGRIVFRDSRENMLSAEDMEAAGCAAALIGAEIGRRRSERALAESEMRYRTCLEQSLQGVAVVQDNPFKVISINAYFAKLLGLAPEELVEAPFQRLLDLIFPEDRRSLVDRYARRLAGTPDPGPFEVRLRAADGSVRWFEALAAGITVDGMPAVQAAFVDITERKKAQKSLEESEEKYRNLVEQANDGIAIVQDGKLVFVNKHLAEMGGMPVEWITGRYFHEFIHPEELAKVSDNYLKRQKGEQVPSIYESVLLGHGGRRIDVEFNAGVSTYNGRPANIVVIRDVTERKAAQAALKAGEDRFRELFDNMSSGMAVLSAAEAGGFALVAVNRAVEAATGTTRDGVAGRDVLDAFPFLGEAGVAPVLFRVFETGKPEIIRPARFEIGGRAFWWSMRVFKLPSGELVFISDDVTREMEAERALSEKEQEFLHSQKMEAVGRLAGGIAHDFNNLLTVINGFAEVAMDRIGGDDPARQDVREILRAGEKAADLTNQLLAFSRRQMLKPRVLNLNAVVSDMQKLLRRLIGEDIELVTLLDPLLRPVRADQPRIEQVVMNLAVNARDAMPEGGRITMETRNVTLRNDYAEKHAEVTPGEYVMLAVSDTGIGMAKNVQELIFEPFFTTKEPGKGTGLGLSMVYGIIKQSGGHIFVYSEPGHGSTFKIYLPVFDGPADADEKFEDRAELTARGETVLLVEDDDSVRALALSFLTRLGYEVIEVSDGIEALQVCQVMDRPIHVLLTDVVMPGMGGRLLYESVRALRPEIKAIFMSGYTDDTAISSGLLGIGAPFIEKPFSSLTLARKLREVIEG